MAAAIRSVSQRKRIFGNGDGGGSNYSTRSNSPPDLMKSEFQDSFRSMDSSIGGGMDGSYNGSHSASSWGQYGNGVARNNSGDGLRWDSARYARRQRHHSEEMTGPNPPVHSYNGNGGTPNQRGHPKSPHSPYKKNFRKTNRYLEEDFDSFDGNGEPSSHIHSPYGMLNPGPTIKGNRVFHSKWNPFGFSHHGTANNKQMIALFGFFTLALLGIAVYQHDAMLQDALQLKEQEVDHHILHAKELEKRLQTMRQHSLDLEEKLDKSEGEAHLDIETQRKIFHLEHNQLRMQQDLQMMSKRLTKEKYGHGPRYHVQMKLEFDKHSNVYNDHDDGDEIIIETASINDMPHSVYLFLEQVDHQLYDHTYFHRNAAHLVQAGPSFQQNAHSRFRRNPSLNSVIFQEYAPEMTHKQYTLGYPGRPGGPDFYINMRDNSAIHGPDGQHNHYSDLIEDADPCFAKIVKGWNAIERVHRSAVEAGDVIVHPVLIASMKVLPATYVVSQSVSSDERQNR